MPELISAICLILIFLRERNGLCLSYKNEFLVRQFPTMTQTLGRRPRTRRLELDLRVSSRYFGSGNCGTGTRFPPCTFVSPRQYHSISSFCLVILKLPRRSQWLSGLRYWSEAARLLGLRVRISPGVWMSVRCQCCYHVQASATS